MHILIIGGAGYIGSVTAHLAVEHGHQVTIFDNLSSGLEKNIPNTAAFIQGDVTSTTDISALFYNSKFDVVLHFAAKILVPESVKAPYDYLHTNAFGVLNSVENATKSGVRNYILSSTAAVYGIPETLPIREDANKAPINPYGESKLIAEHILSSYEQSVELNWLAFRYFNVAGAYNNIGPDYPFVSHVIPALLDRSLKNQVFTINGTDYDTPDGTCVRDFVHVYDIARAHIMAAEKMSTSTKFCTAINLGSSTGYSVKQIVDEFLHTSGKKLTVQTAPRRDGDPDSLLADASKAKVFLDWQPTKTLPEIIDDHIAWYDSLPASARVKNI